MKAVQIFCFPVLPQYCLLTNIFNRSSLIIKCQFHGDVWEIKTCTKNYTTTVECSWLILSRDKFAGTFFHEGIFLDIGTFFHIGTFLDIGTFFHIGTFLPII
jgi:hypothetical protein